MTNRLVRFFMDKFIRDEKGQGMAEYGLILGLIAVVVIGVLTTMGEGLLARFQEIVNALTG